MGNGQSALKCTWASTARLRQSRPIPYLTERSTGSGDGASSPTTSSISARHLRSVPDRSASVPDQSQPPECSTAFSTMQTHDFVDQYQTPEQMNRTTVPECAQERVPYSRL
eukprot:3907473-Rhodomonas_salina.5